MKAAPPSGPSFIGASGGEISGSTRMVGAGQQGAANALQEARSRGRAAQVAWTSRALSGMAEGVGFEPTVPCSTAVFKTAALNHSATPPRVW